jgi:peptidyl-prolyl cis-trans isomerase A (cyclophilin A)
MGSGVDAMLRLIGLALLLTAPALAQEAPPPPPPLEAPAAAPAAPAPPPAPNPPPVFATVKIAIETAQGQIVLALEKQRAPLTTAYFLKYVDQKRFDGLAFYRANKLVADGSFGLIQGGTRGDPKRNLPAVAHEPTTRTGLTHTDGAISLARAAPGTAQGDFFIAIGDLSSLDADPAKPGDNQGFAAFGRVIAGMEIVHKILDLPVSATGGSPAMKGQILVQPVKITSVHRMK